MQKLIKGEKRKIGIEVVKADGEDFNITSFKCKILDRKYDEIEQIADDETDKEGKELYCYIDTDKSIYEVGKSYLLMFTVELEEYNKTLKEAVNFKIVSRR